MPFESELGTAIGDAYKQIVLKEVERPKLLPTEIVELMKSEGYSYFRLQEHTKLWQKMDGKNPGKGYGYELGGRWFWYGRWLEVVRKHCAANADTYTADSKLATTA